MLALQVFGEPGHLWAAAVERSQGFARFFVFHELKYAEEPFVANIADGAIFLLHGFEARGEIAPLALDVGKDFLFFVDLQISDGSRTTNGVAAVGESAPKHVRLKILGDGIGNNHGPKGKVAAREALGASHDIRTNAVMLRSEPFTGPAESTHDLVVYQQDAVFVAESPELRIVVVRRNEQAV